MKERLDKVLVNKNFYSTRARAQEAMRLGLVSVNGKVVFKASAQVNPEDKIEASPLGYVSRAEQKLKHAIAEFGLNLKDKTILDVGASTGGFTKCALDNGAKQVYAIDVGCNQLDFSLVENPQVVNLENTNFLDVSTDILNKAEFIVCDVSFVSLVVLKEKFAKADCPVLVLIKPQFECGKQYAKKHGGVVKDKKVHAEVVANVINEFSTAGLNIQKLTHSPILGGDGNREFLALFDKNLPAKQIDIEKIVEKAGEVE